MLQDMSSIIIISRRIGCMMAAYSTGRYSGVPYWLNRPWVGSAAAVRTYFC